MILVAFRKGTDFQKPFDLMYLQLRVETR